MSLNFIVPFAQQAANATQQAANATQQATQPAAETAQKAQEAGGGFMGLVPMIVIMGVLIWFVWRGQKKEQKRRQEMIEGVKVGDRIVTIGGIYGEVITVKEKTFIVKIADNTRIEIIKSAVSAAPAGEEAAK